jgi:hypothetical protein
MLGMVVIPRDAALVEAEGAMSLALLTLVLGTRPWVTPTIVGKQLRSVFGLDDGLFSISRMTPDDFIVLFSSAADLETVLRTLWPASALFTLHWRR